jgi:hypothetical protein
MDHDQNDDFIEAELRDLDGLLADLYRRVVESNPDRAQEIARALTRNAYSFAQVARGAH